MIKKYLWAFSLISVFVMVAMHPSSVDAALNFTYKVIDNQGLSDVWFKAAGDINGDGLADLVAGGNSAGGLVWYQAPNWTKRTIAGGSGFRTDGEVVDMDRDGDRDVLVLASGDIRWYENPSWGLRLITYGTMHDVEAADLDGDGDVDLVARDQAEFGHTGNVLHIYRQNSPNNWSYRGVNCANGEGLKLADMDRDGDVDVVIEGTWYENTRDILAGAWTGYRYTTSWTHPNSFVGVGDINRDGRVDVVLAPSELAGQTYRISWFEAPANPKSGTWAERVVENNVEAVYHYVEVGDLDRDGDADIAAAEMEQGADPDEVKIYLNANGVGSAWTEQVLGTGGSHSMRLVDAGGDGDLDLFGGNWLGNQVELWENQGSQVPVTNSVGVFRPSNGLIYLKNSHSSGFADVSINYGMRGDYPIAGDWNGDGIDTIGVYRDGVFYLRNSNTAGNAEVYFTFGSPGDQPIAGDWNGDGIDTIGVYRSSSFTFYLRNSNTAGPPDVSFSLGMPGDVGIAGDWNGDGRDTTGVFRPSNGVIFLKNTNQTGNADVAINYGIGGDKPVTGDWNDDGVDTIGVLRGNVFYLRNSNTVGFADITLTLGLSGDMPIAGNWDGLP